MEKELFTTREKKLFSTRDVADIIGYSTEHVRELIRQGKLRSVKPNGGKMFITRSALNEFMNGK